MKSARRSRPFGIPPRLAILTTLGLTLLCPAAARAEVTSGSSTGYGAYIDLNLLAVNLITVGPAGVSTGTAPPPYTESGTFAGINASVLALIDATSGVISSSAQSNIDGTLGSKQATATGTIDGTNLVLGPVIIGNPLLSLTATALSSTSTVAGDYGVLTPTGSSTIAGLAINVLGVALTIPVNPAPNTGLTISGVVGLSVILNEQIVSQTAGQTSIETNAVAIRLNAVNIAGIGLVSGEILLGHSEAIVFATPDAPPAVPEPSSLALLGIGGGLVYFGRHRLRRRKR